jgi:hypothetical protein
VHAYALVHTMTKNGDRVSCELILREQSAIGGAYGIMYFRVRRKPKDYTAYCKTASKRLSQKRGLSGDKPGDAEW